MKIFVSSTFQDLEAYREAALRGLRQLGHEVIAMEDFTAASSPPLKRVLEKVQEADAYVGVFAWRYGYVAQDEAVPADLPLPADYQPGVTSITHAEYLAAKEREIPLLAFLLDEATPWPPHLIDAFQAPAMPPAGQPAEAVPGEHIRDLRAELQTRRTVAFFNSPQDLEARVATAVTVLGMSLQVSTNLIPLTQPVKMVSESDARDSLRNAVIGARENGKLSLTIDLDTEWWSTKLFLLAVLAERFSDVQRVVVLEGSRFVGLLSLATITRGLRQTDDFLGRFTKKLRTRAPALDRLGELDATLDLWEQIYAGQEFDRKIVVTVPSLREWFGEAMLELPVSIDDLGAASVVDLLRILDYPSDFVPVQMKTDSRTWLGTGTGDGTADADGAATWKSPLVVIDKRALNAQLAQKYLDELMDRARLR